MRSKLSKIAKTWEQVRQEDLGCSNAFIQLNLRGVSGAIAQGLCRMEVNPNTVCIKDCIFSAMDIDDNLMHNIIQDLNETVGY